MDFAILGGDERFGCLAGLLERRGFDARRLWARGRTEPGTSLAEAKNVVLNYPLRLRGGPDFDEVLVRLAPEATLWLCGPGAPDRLPEGRRVENLWEDEALLADNAALTAEGAVCAAMTAARRRLRELPALVIGWGRIGQAMSELLAGMGAEVTVASRSEAHRRQAGERGFPAVDTEGIADVLPGRKLIFNTAPARVLGEEELSRVDADAMLIDLASPPYGIDLGAAWNRGLRAWREPGLPGRYCPMSAAGALLRAMERRHAQWRA